MNLFLYEANGFSSFVRVTGYKTSLCPSSSQILYQVNKQTHI